MTNPFDTFKFDPIKQASETISDISKRFDASSKELIALLAENEILKQSIPLVISILEHVTKSGQLIVEGIESTNALMDAFKQQYEEFDHARFQTSLVRFTNDSFAIGIEVARILDKRIEFPSEFLIDLIEKLPKFMLFGVSIPVDSIPDWDVMPNSVLKVLRQIPSLNETRSRLCQLLVEQEEIYDAVFNIQVTIQLIKNLLHSINEILPRDLTVTVAAQIVVGGGGGGGGGGTTLLGHPIRLPFNLFGFVFNLVDTITSRYIQLYQTCATESWQSSVIDQLAHAVLDKETMTRVNKASNHLTKETMDKVNEVSDQVKDGMGKVNEISDQVKDGMSKLK